MWLGVDVWPGGRMHKALPVLASRNYFLWQSCLQGSLVKRTNSHKEMWRAPTDWPLEIDG